MNCFGTLMTGVLAVTELTFDEIITAADTYRADAEWFQHYGNPRMAHASMLRALLELNALPEAMYMRFALPLVKEIQALEAVIKQAVVSES
jgi:hypothetical protein